MKVVKAKSRKLLYARVYARAKNLFLGSTMCVEFHLFPSLFSTAFSCDFSVRVAV